LLESWMPDMNHRFLFITSGVVSERTWQFFSQAGVQFLRKPFRIQDLLEAVECLFNRTQPLDSLERRFLLSRSLYVSGFHENLGISGKPDASGSSGGDDVSCFERHDSRNVRNQRGHFEDQVPRVGFLERPPV